MFGFSSSAKKYINCAKQREKKQTNQSHLVCVCDKWIESKRVMMKKIQFEQEKKRDKMNTGNSRFSILEILQIQIKCGLLLLFSLLCSVQGFIHFWWKIFFSNNKTWILVFSFFFLYFCWKKKKKFWKENPSKYYGWWIRSEKINEIK